MNDPATPVSGEHRKLLRIDGRVFFCLLLFLVGGAIVRSALTTQLDDFTVDEPYHIAAGVSYIRHGDFRLNPEHPPFVKLWIGCLMSATGFHLSPFREIHDKNDERHFTEGDVFLHNDPDSVQRRSRIGMWTLNGLLLLALGLALRRAFSAEVALGTVLFLAIDPTVAGHLPTVMTDLPVSLLAATALVLAVRAFKRWLWVDILACSIALGFTLATKHSAPVIYVFLGLTGATLAMLVPLSGPGDSSLRRVGKLAVVLLGALILLWGAYFFRFRESNTTTQEVFNRPLADKITDVHSHLYRFALTQMAKMHILPRAYIWGLADTIRAGAEGRAHSRLAFGKLYYIRVPRYFFPGVIALKLPVGLDVIILLGIVLFGARRLPHYWLLGLSLVLIASLWYLIVLSSGSPYGGIRHALPAVVLLATMGGICVHAALYSNSIPLRAIVVLSFLLAAASALPVMRPSEYYNEIIGGKDKAYLYFNDEGLDLCQRGQEIAKYYYKVLQPAGELAYLDCCLLPDEAKARKLDFVGLDLQRDMERFNSKVQSGTILINARDLGKHLWWDVPALRAATPVARYGNLMVFRGTFYLPAGQAEGMYFQALEKLYAEKPDLIAAEQFLAASAAADPSAFFVSIELGNLCLKRGSRANAVRAYSAALSYAPNDRELRRSIQDQIQRVATDNLDTVPALRNPQLE